jgi:anti-anti-sigma factor
MPGATTDRPPTPRETAEGRHDPANPGSGPAGRPELGVRFERRGRVLIVHLVGELDIYTVPMLQRQLDRHDRPDAPLVVDLAEVELIDSCGLGFLVSLRNRAAVAERNIGLVLVDARLKEILRITGLADAFAQEASVDAACAAVSAVPPGTS